ncbi:MAG: hypothetical protein ILO68_01075 [Clostridia bacterium]|nr:hypothetical protein [Clostridia bacterium]
MTGPVIAAVAVGAVVLLLVVIAFLRVRVTAGYADYPFLYYQVGPLRIPLVDKGWISEDLTDHSKRDKWQARRRRQLEAERKKGGKGKAGAKKGPVYRKKDLKDMAVVIKDLIVGILGYVRRYACLESLRIKLLAASDDAMKTAVLYGDMQALLAAVAAALDGIPPERKKEDRIRLEAECDFLAEHMEADAEICVTMRVWQALVTRSWYTEEIKKLWELLMKETPRPEQGRT